jgi:hypothetical protein
MEAWSIEKKWLMIHQDHQAERITTNLKPSKSLNVSTERTNIDTSRLPVKSNGSPISPLSPTPSRLNYGPSPIKSSSSPIQLVNNSNKTNKTTPIANNNPNIIHASNKSPTSPTLMRSQSTVLSASAKKSNNINDHHFDTLATENNTPEFFVRKFLDPNLRSVTPKIAASLEVCLRTRSIK